MQKCIIFDNGKGGVSVIIPAPNCGLTIEEIAAKDAPAGSSPEIVSVDNIPTDRTFREAWQREKGAVVEHVEKSRVIAHEMRRLERSEEFKPFDAQATIPFMAEKAEEGRAKIRQKYDEIQKEMDATPNVGGLRVLVKGMKEKK